MNYFRYDPRAALYALGGGACWVSGDVFLKLAGQTSVPKYEIMTLGGLGGMISILAACGLRKQWKVLVPSHYSWLSLLGLWMFLGYMSYLAALPVLPMANFYVVVFLAPILIPFLAAFFLREGWSWRQLGAILCGFIGVVIAVRPGSISTGGTAALGYATAFAAMFCVTAQLLTLRVLGKRETKECTAFYPRLGPILGGLLLMLWFGYEPMPFKIACYSLGIGAIGGIGWMLMAHAYQLAPAGMVAPFQYAEILFGAIAGFLVWGEVPSLQLAIGSALIIASGIYLALHARKPEELPLAI